MYRLFWSVILSIAVVSCGFSVSRHVEKITVEAGEDVRLKCVEEEVIYARLPYGLYDVIWKIKHGQDRPTTLTDGEDVTIQACGEQKFVECGGINILSVLKLSNLSSSNSGMYMCYVTKKSSEQLIHKTRLTVGYAPQEPLMVLDNSTMDLDTKVFTFCWDTQRPTGIPTTYEMTKYSADCERRNVRSVCCHAKVENRYERQKVALRATNEFGNATAVEHLIVPSMHVKPPAPANLVVKAEVIQNVNDILVEWAKPDVSGLKIFDYRVMFSEDKAMKNWTTEYGTTETRHRIENLKSSTFYAVRVSAKPENSSIYDGVWSDWSISASTRTGVTAPSKRFALFHSGTSLVRLEEKTFYSIDMFWKPYKYQHEDGFYNLISCGNCFDEKEEFRVGIGSQFSYNTTWSKVCCEGAYCNDAGCSKKQSITINSPKTKVEIETAQPLSLNETHLTFRWNGLTKTHSCIVRVCWKIRTGSNYNDSEMIPYDKCLANGFLIWQTYNLNCLGGEYALTGSWNSCYSYRVVMECRLQERTTIKSRASDTIEYDEDFSKDEGLSVFVAGSSRLEVTWSHKAAACGFMTRQIRYQPKEGAECDRHFGATCRPMYHTVPCNATKVVMSKNVYGGQMYSVEEVATCSEAAKKAEGTSAIIRTISAGAVYVSTPVRRPEGAPSSLQLSSYASPKTDMRWNPPLHPNGRAYYKISSRKAAPMASESVTSTSANHSMQVDISCIPGHDDTKVSFTVTPYTISEDNGTYFYGKNATLSGISCVPVEEPRPLQTVVFLVIGCIALLAVSLAGIFCYYHRQKIRARLKSKMWTDLPKPVTKNPMAPEYVATYSMATGSRMEQCIPIRGQTKNHDERPHMILPEESAPQSSAKIDVHASPAGSMRYLKTSTTCPSSIADVEYVVEESADNAHPLVRDTELTQRNAISEKSKMSISSTGTHDGSGSSTALKQYVRVTQRGMTSPAPDDGCVAHSIHSANVAQNTCGGRPRCSSLDEDVEYVTETTPFVDEIDSCQNCGTNQAPGRRWSEGSDTGDSGYKAIWEGSSEPRTFTRDGHKTGILSNVDENVRESSEEGYTEDTTALKHASQKNDFLDDVIYHQTGLPDRQAIASRHSDEVDYLKNNTDSTPEVVSRGSHSSGIEEDLEDMDFEMEKFLDGCFSAPDKHEVFSRKNNTDITETLKVADEWSENEDASYVDIDSRRQV